jgi:hypothetical protein
MNLGWASVVLALARFTAGVTTVTLSNTGYVWDAVRDKRTTLGLNGGVSYKHGGCSDHGDAVRHVQPTLTILGAS